MAAVRLEVAVAGALQEGRSVSVLEVQLWGEDEEGSSESSGEENGSKGSGSEAGDEGGARGVS